ncbi:MAG TPA: ABC transporter transmembrane domain-containing protein, partial [Vicinamibacterales bacterium]|nr:ABC transporter transmembrane domain-containing protein [Vicinamibacterales bacterium]
MPEVPKKKKIRWSAAWAEARDLIWARRQRLLLGLILMLISRLAGMVLPYLSKFLIDDLVANRVAMLPRLAWIVGAATVVQAVTSFALSQVLGVAAQRAITDMRRRVEEH